MCDWICAKLARVVAIVEGVAERTDERDLLSRLGVQRKCRVVVLHQYDALLSCFEGQRNVVFYDGFWVCVLWDVGVGKETEVVLYAQNTPHLLLERFDRHSVIAHEIDGGLHGRQPQLSILANDLH